jgi:hypothetical protein
MTDEATHSLPRFSRKAKAVSKRQIITLIAVFFITLVFWAFPPPLILATVANTSSLFVALVVLYAVIFPFYVWLLVLFLQKMNAMPHNYYACAFLCISVASLCMALPFMMLNSWYGFAFPLPGNAYRYDTCALQFGAGQSPGGRFDCIDAHGNILRP